MGNHLTRSIQNLWYKIRYARTGMMVKIMKIEPGDKMYMIDMLTGELMKDNCPMGYILEQKSFLDDCHDNVDLFVENEKNPGDILMSLAVALEIAHQKTKDRVIEYSFNNLLREYYNKGILGFTPTFLQK